MSGGRGGGVPVQGQTLDSKEKTAKERGVGQDYAEMMNMTTTAC